MTNIATSLGVASMDVGRVISLLVNTGVAHILHKVNPSCVCLVGEAGIGKTAAVRHAATALAKRLGTEVQVLTYSLLAMNPEDLQGYPVVGNDNQMRFAPHSSLVAAAATELPTLLFIDELNRANKEVAKVMFGAIEGRELGDFRIPDNWMIVTAINPSEGGNYSGTSFSPFQDAAWLRRLCIVHVEFSAESFLSYAKSAEFHPVLVAYLTQFPANILDVPGRNKGMVAACPSSWEKVSQLMYVADQESWGATVQRSMFTPLIGNSVASALVQYVSTYLKEVSVEEILSDYSQVRKWVLQLKSGKHRDRLATLVQACVSVAAERNKAPLEDFPDIALPMSECIPSLRNFVDTSAEFRKRYSAENQTFSTPLWMHNLLRFMLDLPNDLFGTLWSSLSVNDQDSGNDMGEFIMRLAVYGASKLWEDCWNRGEELNIK